MFTSIFTRALLVLSLLGITLQMTSCGTILYPERRGQNGGQLDPAVVVLDAVGLLFFLIPGVIAFAVDFTTGTIYLPPGHEISGEPMELEEMIAVQVDTEGLSDEAIEQLVFERTGQRIDMEQATVVEN